jgi:uncharacterized membrane protein
MILYKVKDVRRLLFGLVLALAVFGSVFAISYSALVYFYGETSPITSTQNIAIWGRGRYVIVDNGLYWVNNAEPDENTYMLDLNLISESYGGGSWNYLLPTTPPPQPIPAESSSRAAPTRTTTSINVPKEVYENAQNMDGPVIVSNVTTIETKPIDAPPIATAIGVAMSLVTLAVWVGYKHPWGEATSTLIEHGLHDMTVRDVEIVGYIMGLKEFTIPELMKMTKASKITVWRTVQKLLEKGLVQQTEKTKLAANGLGGRGKPSIVYKYIGAKE